MTRALLLAMACTLCACAPRPLEVRFEGEPPAPEDGVLVVTLAGWPDPPEQRLEGGRQSRSGSVVQVVRPDRPLRVGVSELDAQAWADSLACDEGCRSTLLDPAVSDVVGVGESVRARAVRASSLVASHVRAKRVVRTRTPAQTWRSARGDCTEMAELTVALLRRADVPARAVSGAAWIDEAWRPHAWVEYAAGETPEAGWASADPAFGVVPAALDRVRLFAWPSAGWESLRDADGEVGVRILAGPQNARRDEGS